ncbi:MAG: hypothetical protein H0T60_16320 [Acidobacteria bacterium]|nr:hypothetical protein [Acidobacteriota bacterium]
MPFEKGRIDEARIEKAKLLFDFDSWQFENPSRGKIFLQGGTLEEASFPGWTPLRIERVEMLEGAALFESMWRPVGIEDGTLLLINIYEGVSDEDAREWLLLFLASLHSYDGVRKETDKFARVYFTLADKCGIIFGLSNRVIMLGAVGKRAIAVDEVAENLFR